MARSKSVIDRIKDQGILPLFYHDSADVCRQVVGTLYDAGIRIVEFTNRGENAVDNFKQLLKWRDQNWPGLVLAIGTIKTVKDAKPFIKAGADIIISPGIVEEVGERAHDNGILWIPGCMTTTEIMLAEANAARLVKLFPGSLLGPGFVSSVKELFPSMDFMPTGGVEVEHENLAAWFKSGVIAVGLGSKLITKSILENRQYDQLKESTQNVLELVRSVR